MTQMDKDKLAAFVDGELSPEEAAQVVMHLADHPEDQAYVDDLFAANEALSQAFSGPLSEPVPASILAAVLGEADRPAPAVAPAPTNVVAFRRPRGLAFAGLAIAASLGFLMVLGPELLPRSPAAGIGLGPLAAADPVVEVLESRVSGDPATLADGRDAMVLASFALPDGRLCREFEVIDAAKGRVDYALGCAGGEGWVIEAVIAEAVDDRTVDGFAPAEGAEAEALTHFLARYGAPEPLAPEDEAAAIRQGWSQ